MDRSVQLPLSMLANQIMDVGIAMANGDDIRSVIGAFSLLVSKRPTIAVGKKKKKSSKNT